MDKDNSLEKLLLDYFGNRYELIQEASQILKEREKNIKNIKDISREELIKQVLKELLESKMEIKGK